MADEIERKFLVRNKDWRLDVIKQSRIKQGYIAVNNQCAVRVRITDTEALLSIKSSGLAISRKEYEYLIPVEDALEMMERFCPRHYVQKTRHYVRCQHKVWEVDVFEGLNQGLVVAEIELESESEAIALPDWVGQEVSGEARYLNNNLAVEPFQAWPK